MAKNIWVDHFGPFWTVLTHFGTLMSLPCLALLLILSARDDLVKVSLKSDARKCQNQVTLAKESDVIVPFKCTSVATVKAFIYWKIRFS